MLRDSGIFCVSSLVCLCTVYLGLFAFPLGIIARLGFMIMALPGHL